MVFFGRDFFEREQPELLAAVRRQADAFGWAELVDRGRRRRRRAWRSSRAHDPDATARHAARRAPASPGRADAWPTTASAAPGGVGAVLADDFARVRADLDGADRVPADVIAEADACRARAARCATGRPRGARRDAPRPRRS